MNVKVINLRAQGVAHFFQSPYVRGGSEGNASFLFSVTVCGFRSWWLKVGTLGCWMAFAMFDPGRWLYSVTRRTAVVHLAEVLISAFLQRWQSRELMLVH